MDKGIGMSKHTPVPPLSVGSRHGDWYTMRDANGRVVGTVSVRYGEEFARLIAAAPDLLEACKASEEAAQAAIAASEACPDGQRIPEHEAQRVDALYMRAEKLRRAAIKKATQ